MNINFSNDEIIFLYGRLRQRKEKLEIIKQSPQNPISTESIDQELNLYISMLSKLKEAVPQLSKMDNFNV